VSRGPSSTCPAVRSMCRADSSTDAHTWPSAGHAQRILSQAIYALTESWNGSGRGSRHPAPPRMKKRRAEPPRDQPGANSHASCSPTERRQETAGARPAAMAELRLLYVPMSRLRRCPQDMVATPPMLPRVWPSGGTRRRRELGRPPCPSAHGACARGGIYHASPRPAEQRQ
jgi:hypothetical protein